MNRIGYLYKTICSLENLQKADVIARRRKGKQKGIQDHDRNQEANIAMLHHCLVNKSFKTSPYVIFPVYEPKKREVYRLPYYPDRILHHAIMNVLESVFVSTFTTDSYSCIKGKGIHAASAAVKKAFRDVPGTKYCLEMDVRKFYPNVDHDILKALLRRKLKDPDLLWLLDEIIDSADGLPIGNYLSQYFANFYLTYFDHWLKEKKGVKYYFRYTDNMVVLSGSKEYLHQLRKDIQEYLRTELKLELKPNYQVFPVASRGVNLVGYIHFHTHTRLRKRIKKNFARMMSRHPNLRSAASYYGWAKHADCKNLIKTLFTHETVQRFQHRAGPKGIHRRQNKDRKDIEQTDNSPGV